MAFITGIPIRDSIHSDFSTGSGVWLEYRRNLTGLYLSGVADGTVDNYTGSRYHEFADHDFREFNRKVNMLSGLWNTTGVMLDPYDGGFRYTGAGSFVAP